MVKDRDGMTWWWVHCFCMYGGGGLLERLLGVSRSIEREVRTVFSYILIPEFLLSAFFSCCIIGA